MREREREREREQLDIENGLDFNRDGEGSASQDDAFEIR